MKKQMVVVAGALLVLAGCSSKPGSGEPGAKLLEERCLRCHPMGVKKAHTTPVEWEQTVTRMMGKGVTLTPAEKATLVDFLARNYKP